MSSTLSGINKPKAVALIRHIFKKTYPHLDPQKACLYWAVVTQRLLKELGKPAILQVGSLQWPRIRPEDDDGVIHTHFSYMWDWEEAKNRMKQGLMPEFHAWVAVLTDPPEIVDVTTCYLPAQALELANLIWTAPAPPDFLWGGEEDIPDGVRYRPDVKAIQVAHTILGE